MSETKNNTDTVDLDPNTERVLGELLKLPMGGKLEVCLVGMAEYEEAGPIRPTSPYTYQPMGETDREDGEELGWLRVDGEKAMLTPKGREVAGVSLKLGRGV